jgi:hypothetical protein
MATPEPPLWANGQYLYDLCHAILVAASALLSPAPDRQYVSHGPPPWDAGLSGDGCKSQLTVGVDRIRSSLQPTLNQLLTQGSKQVVPVADIEVVLLRCAVTMQGRMIPTSAELDAESLALAVEAQALWGGLVTASMDGTLFPTMHNGQFLWRGMEAVGPNGGLAGWRMTLEVGLA